MSVDDVRNYLEKFGRGQDVLEFEVSSATVELAAIAVGVEGARIAKTLSFRGPEAAQKGGADFSVIMVVCAGDAKVNNSKFKQRFGLKSKMLGPEEVLPGTGHAIGGVCPFAVSNPLAEIYLDESLRRFSTVFPACGSSNSAIEMTCEELLTCSGAKGWVDVCKLPEAEEEK